MISDIEESQGKCQERLEEREMTSKFVEGRQALKNFLEEMKVKQLPEERQGCKREN